MRKKKERERDENEMKQKKMHSNLLLKQGNFLKRIRNTY